MISDPCLLCARNKARRWLEHHVPQVSGGLTGAGLAVVIAGWSASGVAGWASFAAGYAVWVAGITSMIAWLAGWRPSFRWRMRRAVRRLR